MAGDSAVIDRCLAGSRLGDVNSRELAALWAAVPTLGDGIGRMSDPGEVCSELNLV